jgi:heme-degrading monooxygenase HmoA
MKMTTVSFHNSYKLKKGALIPDFLLAVENLNNEYISKQKGYISFELLSDGDTWADTTKFETLEDAENFAKCGTSNEFAQKFYSFINLNSCKSNLYSIEKSYK